ncbi:hypothetical protein ACNKU3_17015 [Haliea sp. E17]
MLAGLFLLALVPRLYSAVTLGWNWDRPGSFTLVNFDEGGSCRAALDGFTYSPLTGYQTIAITSLLGYPPPEGVRGNASAVKAYCHSPQHIRVARVHSAVLGALTAVAVALLTLQLMPAHPGAAWFAAGLVAVSGFHISQSQSGTVDAPSTFFIYALLACVAWALRRRSAVTLACSIPLLVAAVWTKFWAFALFAYLPFLPPRCWTVLREGWGDLRIVLLVLAVAVWMAALSNQDFSPNWWFAPLAAYALVVPWNRLRVPLVVWWLLLPALLWLLLTRVGLVHTYTMGIEGTAFGSGYADIGANKWLRNLVNLPAVLLVGLGIPACLLLFAGCRYLYREQDNTRLWLVLLPVAGFALFMAFLAPVTYYRHYLPLLPGAAIVIAAGAASSGWLRRPWLALAVLGWSALLAWDMVSDYHNDPRRELRPWFAARPAATAYFSYYVNPPPGTRVALFRPEYAAGDAASLRQADYVILSENWYDTAFANELNGPRTDVLERLVKTTPAHALFYRRALAGENPLLEEVQAFELPHFMPELLLHRAAYGNFQLFVGDLRIFRVRH